MFNYQDFLALGPPSHHRPRVTPAEDREGVLRMVRGNGCFLQHVAPEYRADREVVLAAVQQWGGALRDAATELRADREVVLAAVQHYGRALRDAASELRADREVVLAAVEQDENALQYAAPELRADRDFVLAAVEQYGGALVHAAPELLADREVVLAAVQTGDALWAAAPELRADREVVLAAVQQSGGALEFAAPELRADKEVVLAAVIRSPGVLEFAAEQLQADREVVLAAVKRYGLSLDDDDLVFENPLPHASDELLADRDFVVEVLKLGGDPFDFVPDQLRDDEELQLLACRCSPQHKEEYPQLAGPSESAIAVKGEDCPMVSVRLASGHTNGDEWNDQTRIAFDVSLLSGTTFTCHLDGPNPNVNDLAKQIVEDWPAEAGSVDRVFIAIVRENGAEDEVEDDLQITPWDYDRPLTDFLKLKAQ